MKKLFSIFGILGIVLLGACGKVEYIEVPGETEYIEIITEVEVPVIETVTEIITEIVTEIVEVPINVEYERFYKPGVYFNNTRDVDGVYTYCVLVVDAYGKIAGIMFDDTKSTSEFYIDEDNKLYVFIEGDGKTVPHTFRYIASDAAFEDYPSTLDAITSDDLVMGIHQNKIETLTEVQSNESSRILGEVWVKETDLLAKKIIEDQTTFGINLFTQGNDVTTTNVEGVNLTNVDVYLDLVQSILNNEASEPDLDVLKTTPVIGLYTPGGAFGFSKRLVGDSIYYYTSFVTVDEYGRIAGVYTDSTVNGLDDEHSTMWILKDDYEIDSNLEWYLQAKNFGKAVTSNQGVDGFTLYNDVNCEEEVEGFPVYSDGHFIFENSDQEHVYTDQIEGTTIGVEGMITATRNALNGLSKWELNDGTYFVSGSGDNHSILTVNVEDNLIESIFLDSTEGTDQAEVYRDDEWFSLYKFNRTWIDAADEEQTTVILVYKDGSDYLSLNDVVYDDEEIEADDEIDLEDDEKATLELIAGNNTIRSLGERYGLGEVSEVGDWNDQINAFTEFFQGKDTPYRLNLTNGYTDSIAGVSIHIEEYEQLLIEALILASDDHNALIDDVAISSSAPPLANGTYYASLEPNDDGEQSFAFMNVTDNEIQSIVFDSTIARGDLVTTKLSLKDAYGLKKIETQAEWYEQSAMFSIAVLDNQEEIIEAIEDGYNYKSSGEFGESPYHILESDDPDEEDFDLDMDSESGATIDIKDFKLLTDDLIQQALKALVKERAEEILTSLIDGDNILVSEEDYEHELSGDLEIGTGGYLFEVDWDTSDNDVFDVNDGSIYIKVEELDRNETETLTLTLTYDKTEYTREVEYNCLTALSAELMIIDEFIAELEEESFVVIEGHDYDLDPIDCEYLSADWIWFDDDGHKIYSTEDLGKGVHTLELSLEYDEDDFVTKEVIVTIVDVDDAMENVKDSLAPGNILNNGEVTREGTIELQSDSGFKGITITWDIDVDSDADGIEYDQNVLTMNRTYENEKVVLTATIKNTVNDDKEVVDFEFRVVAANEELVEKRIIDTINRVLSEEDTKLPDSIVDTKLAIGSSKVKIITLNNIIEEDDFEYDAPDIEWTVLDEDGEELDSVMEYNGALIVTNQVEGKVFLTLHCTVDMNGDDEAEVSVTKTFEIDLFISTTLVE